VDVAHHDLGAGGTNRLVVGDVVERRGDDLVARSDPGRQQRDVQRRRPGVRADDVAIAQAEVGGDPLFELFGRRAHPEPADVERVGQVLERVHPDVRRKNRYPAVRRRGDRRPLDQVHAIVRGLR
jgi:hypothetical protein